LDYDDAIWFKYKESKYSLVRKFLATKLDKLMRRADLVVAGNAFLEETALLAGAKRTLYLPTSIDIIRYSMKTVDVTVNNGKPIIVWIGSPSTGPYLEEIAGVLRAVNDQAPFTLRIIGAKPDMPGLDVEYRKWSVDTEVQDLRTADIGIMPLANTAWARGKCGYKLVQYMGCGLPVVASPVGCNSSIVDHNESGFLADSDENWVEALVALISLESLRIRMGMRGRRKVEMSYCKQVTGPKLIEAIRSAADQKSD
jgi:glycosyltransferase involved in cell wall biosynthesis